MDFYLPIILQKYNNLVLQVQLRAFLLLLLLFAGDYALSINEPFRFVSPELNLPEHNISDIIEDYKGFIWIATQNGLCRYDGYEIMIYVNDRNDSTTISNNFINALYQTKDSVLLVATMKGLNIYNRNRNNFIKPNIDSTRHSMNDLVIWDIAEDQNGNIWLATKTGVFVWKKLENKLQKINTSLIKNNQSNSENFRAIIVDKKGIVFAGNSKGNVFSFNNSGNEVTCLKFDNGNGNQDKFGDIKKIYCTSDSVIWIGTLNTGLIKINTIKNGHVWYDNYLEDTSTKNSISANSVLSFCELNNNKLLIGTENSGLDVLDRKSGKFTVYKASNKKDNSIAGNSVRTIFKDHLGNIWFGFYDYGLNILFNSSDNFKDYKNNVCNPQSISYGIVKSLTEDEKGNMWIGFDGSGLDYWDRGKGIFNHYRYGKTNQVKMLSNVPLCLLTSQSGYIWAAYYGGGVCVIKGNREKYRTFTIKDGVEWIYVMDMAEDKYGNIWMATMGGGLKKYNPKTGKILEFKEGENQRFRISYNFINQLLVDSKGNIWAGYAGVGVDKIYRDSTGKYSVKNFCFEKNIDTTLTDNRVFSLTEDKDGYIWVGTGNGLNKLDPESGKVIRYKDGENLMANVVVGLLSDDVGRIWFSTYDGLKMFDPVSENFFSYSENGRLSSQRFTKRGVAYKSKSGEFFFGGQKGLLSFYPDSVKQDMKDFKLYFTDLLLFNHPVSLDDPYSPLKKVITEADNIVLQPWQSVFTIKYVALNYINKEKVKYAYYLEGFDNKWNYVGNKREATYTNLNPGEYIFKVKCTNACGLWGNNIASIKIKVLPPWWRTNIFYLISILFIVFSFAGYHNMRIHSIAKKKRNLEKEVKERTKELKNVNDYLESRNEEILQQKEEIDAQAKNLSVVNTELEKKTRELIVYKTRLEELVKERTSELEKAKKKAEESERLKSAFLANMSHEIRTPMNAIAGFSQLLKINDLDDESKSLFISQINSNTNTLLTLIDDILALSRIESGQLIIKKEEFEINALLEEVFADAKVLITKEKPKLRLVNVVEKQNLKILSDRTRIKQILNNLLSNACKFTEEGYVELRFEEDANNLRFIVKDTGIGIPKDKLNIIFDRFRVVSQPSNKLYGGTGLGLAISHKLAKLLGGSIEVRSIENEGSVFTLILPCDLIV